ncbi:hypothetical protein GCM10009824_21250 [Kocuria atrinae]|uniref:Tox-PL domain-containing protein n=1 Tax=Kocuria atrinae TaxID=592377 RepID=A0ABN2XZK2_9MICC
MESAQTAQALHAASKATRQAAQMLHQVAVAGRGFVSRYAGAGTGSPQSHTQGDVGSTPGLGGNSRYVPPTPEIESTYQQLVEEFGPDNPERWIAAGNPHYATGLKMWTNNCGPCSRSFADTFHGKSARPALGDSEIPPGEYQEMWDAVGVQPTSKMTNRGLDSAGFTTNAYAALEANLRREGPGAVAIIGVDWDISGVSRKDSGGHWFNAYVDREGNVRWADEQSGETTGWPPGYETAIWQIEAVVRPSADSNWKEIML